MTDSAIIAGCLVDAKRIGRPPVPLRERFERQFIPEPNSGCWLWIGALCGRGYGTIKDEHRVMRRATRVSWELHYGPIPDGLCILHKCDNPVCVNPEHLFPGTNADNTRDMFAKGRTHDMRGRNAKLTPSQVLAIKNDGRAGTEIAAQYGVSAATISNIRLGKRWGYL